MQLTIEEVYQSLLDGGFVKARIKKGSKVFQDFSSYKFPNNNYTKNIDEETIFYCYKESSERYDCVTFGAGITQIENGYGNGSITVFRESDLEFVKDKKERMRDADEFNEYLKPFMIENNLPYDDDFMDKLSEAYCDAAIKLVKFRRDRALRGLNENNMS